MPHASSTVHSERAASSLLSHRHRDCVTSIVAIICLCSDYTTRHLEKIAETVSPLCIAITLRPRHPNTRTASRKYCSTAMVYNRGFMSLFFIAITLRPRNPNRTMTYGSENIATGSHLEGVEEDCRDVPVAHVTRGIHEDRPVAEHDHVSHRRERLEQRRERDHILVEHPPGIKNQHPNPHWYPTQD